MNAKGEDESMQLDGEARYPNGLPESVPAEFFDENDAKGALDMARRAMEVVEEAVPL